MKYCPKDRTHKVSNFDSYCETCGTKVKVKEKDKCPSCGIDSFHTPFCFNCGRDQSLPPTFWERHNKILVLACVGLASLFDAWLLLS